MEKKALQQVMVSCSSLPDCHVYLKKRNANERLQQHIIEIIYSNFLKAGETQRNKNDKTERFVCWC